MRRFITLILLALVLISCGQPTEWKTATVVSFSEPVSGVQIGSYVWIVTFDNGDTHYIEEDTFKRYGPMHVGYRYDYRIRDLQGMSALKYLTLGAYHESITGR